MMYLANVLQMFLSMSMAIDPNCDYYQEVNVGTVYYINNPEYPDNYTSYKSCRWTAISPLNTTIVLSCDPINIPWSADCQANRLAISTSGNTNFYDAHNYCGNGTVTIESDRNTLTVGLFSRGWTLGGLFLCSVTVIDRNELTQAPCMCGWKQGTRIVGGIEAGVNEFPAMAAIIQKEDSKAVYCGGVIISNRYVLSGGHCFYEKNITNMGVLVGDHNITSGDDTPYAALYQIEYAKIHPNYNETTLANDITIIRTASVIIFSNFVGPICLPFKYTSNIFEGEMVTALGWGNIQFSEKPSDVLLKVNLTIVNTYYCSNLVKDKPVTKNQICSYGYNKDTCLRDSGGPILWMDSNKKLELIGLVSFGEFCGTKVPSVNTRVTSYLPWIVSETNDSSYCK